MKSQTSVEYLILVGLGVIIATVISLLALNIFTTKQTIVSMIESYRAKMLGG